MAPQTITIPMRRVRKRRFGEFLYNILVGLNYICIFWTAFSFSASATIAYIYFTH